MISNKKTKIHRKKANDLKNNVHRHRSCLESEEDLQGDQTADNTEIEKSFLKQYRIDA